MLRVVDEGRAGLEKGRKGGRLAVGEAGPWRRIAMFLQPFLADCPPGVRVAARMLRSARILLVFSRSPLLSTFTSNYFQVAARSVEALMRGDRTVVPGWQNKLYVHLLAPLVSDGF